MFVKAIASANDLSEIVEWKKPKPAAETETVVNGKGKRQIEDVNHETVNENTGLVE